MRQLIRAAITNFGAWIHGSSGIHSRRQRDLRTWMPKSRHLNWSLSACYEPEARAVLQPRWRLVANKSA